jgi:Phosphatidylinositol N-acetylglucosaminyltransferase subunit Y
LALHSLDLHFKLSMRAASPYDYRARLHLPAIGASRATGNDISDRKLGFVLLLLFAMGTAALLYAMVISKLLPATGHRVLDAIAVDQYYCFLVPLTSVPAVAAIYFSWMSLKFFRTSV